MRRTADGIKPQEMVRARHGYSNRTSAKGKS